MAWIRDTDEKAQRRPADIALLGVAGLAAVLAGMWAQTQSSVNANLFRHAQRPLREHGRPGQGHLRARARSGLSSRSRSSCCATRQVRVAWHGALAGAGGMGHRAAAQRDARDPRHPGPPRQRADRRRSGLPGRQRRRSSPPSRSAWRRISCVRCAGSSRSSSCWCVRRPCTSAPGFPADVLGGLLVGFAVAALVRVVVRIAGRTAVDRRGRRPPSPTSATTSRASTTGRPNTSPGRR